MTAADDEVEALATSIALRWRECPYPGDAWLEVARFVLAREAAIRAEPPAPDAFKARVAETAREILAGPLNEIPNSMLAEDPKEMQWAIERAEIIETRLAAYLNSGAA